MLQKKSDILTKGMMGPYNFETNVFLKFSLRIV